MKGTQLQSWRGLFKNKRSKKRTLQEETCRITEMRFEELARIDIDWVDITSIEGPLEFLRGPSLELGHRLPWTQGPLESSQSHLRWLTRAIEMLLNRPFRFPKKILRGTRSGPIQLVQLVPSETNRTQLNRSDRSPDWLDGDWLNSCSAAIESISQARQILFSVIEFSCLNSIMIIINIIFGVWIEIRFRIVKICKFPIAILGSPKMGSQNLHIPNLYIITPECILSHLDN